MPFKSKAQMRYMEATHPKTAKKWNATYKVPKNLPERIGMPAAPAPVDPLSDYLDKNGKPKF